YDRPRQKVDYENGKEAITEYEILSVENGKTRIRLYPKTGRTHQLRVHCAHQDGLNCPILGDPLYSKKNLPLKGKVGGGLHLHAEYLEFTHPTTGKRMHFEEKAPF
ncbi:MAG: RNA pseudouridine synthase, partial [Prevotella sp.]|nr:RNA pseudouridine synthase [Prevotella sp.]